MPPLLRSPSRRDAMFILLGAFMVHFFSAVAPLTPQSIVTTLEFRRPVKDGPAVNDYPPQNDQHVDSPPDLRGEFRHQRTTIVEHAPGWTLFRDIYMENGTLLILTSSPSLFPEARYMTSTGLPAENTPESKALREPTPWNLDIVTPEDALQRWGNDPSIRRVWSVEGNTLLFNDPPQFLAHYYHFCAELLFGAWSLWAGAVHPEPPPPIHRAIFPHSSGSGWRDKPGFNSYFLRAAFPSLTVEVDADWNDRVATSASIDSGVHRAWHFPYLLLADRSAAFRGKLCGTQNQRTASESVDALIARSKLDKGGLWWRQIRYAVWHFAGATVDGGGRRRALGDKPLDTSPPPEFEETERVTITYISRQGARRCLIPEDHEALVESLEGLVRRKNKETMNTMHAGGIAGKKWELNVVNAQEMTKDDQVRLAARTTILLGVHGNGLSHLILMPRTHVSAVIEIFYPGGFAHDYEWTTRTLGMGYLGVWNDTYFTGENTPARYPEGFQGDRIPVYGPNIASMIEKRIAGEL